MPGIIVGVDGSDHSRYALAWAMREAAKHELPLTVMSIHPVPVRPVTGIYWGLRSYSESSFDPELARRAVQDFVDKVASETGEAVPEITRSVVVGVRPRNSSGPRRTPRCSWSGPAAAAGSPGSCWAR
jgi:nucleotide-binding universal stress UspA family protein